MKKGFLLSGKKAPRAKVGSMTDAKSSQNDEWDSTASLKRDGRRQPTMKKGFLLGPSDDASSARTSSLHETVSSQTSAMKVRVPKSFTDSKGGMKRGFLLADSPSNNKNDNVNVSNDGKSKSLPQCKLEEKISNNSLARPEQKIMQSRKRVTTTSTALLDFQEPSNSNEHETPTVGDNQQSESEPVVSSLLRLVEDRSGDAEERTPVECDNDLDFDNDTNPSLDSWIQPSSSSRPSIVLPSSSLPGTQRKSSTPKSGRQLIVELEKSPIIQEVNISSNCTNSTNANPDPNLDEPSMADSSSDNRIYKSVGMSSERSPNTYDTPASKLPSRADVNAPPQKDYLCFADVSLLLARLRHSMKLKERSKNEPTKKDSTIGVGMLLNKQSEKMIKSFVTKHWSESESAGDTPELYNLWKMILEPIAQDYTENTQSRKKTRRNTKISMSPPLCLGLGVVEFATPVGAAYDSLAHLMSKAAHIQYTSNNSRKDNIDTEEIKGNNLKVQEGRNKQLKVSALGAVHLLRCRIRCISIKVTKLENEIDAVDAEEMIAELKGVESEVGILISMILPSLESIVCSDTSEGRTFLTSATADACFELIEMASRTVVIQHMLQVSTSSALDAKDSNRSLGSRSMQMGRDILPLIEKLLAVKHRWISRSDRPHQSDNKTESTNIGPSRVTCAMSVLNDWLDIVKTSKRQFFDHFLGDDLHEGADYSAGLNLFWNLSGASLKREDDTSEHTCYFRVGGIAQSLCHNQECAFGSSIISSLHDLGGSAEAEDLVALLHESAKLTDAIRTARKTGQLSEAWTKVNHQRAAIRAFASWLSRGNKAIRILTKRTKKPDGVDMLDSAMSNLIILLRSESKQCVEMSIVSLSMLWSASPEWVHQELRSDKTTQPQYFLDLIDAMQAHSSQSSSNENGEQTNNELIDPTSRALCVVVARVASQRPVLLLPYVLKMKGRVELMIEVVLNMLEQLPNSQPSEHDTKSDNANDVVHLAASKMLLQNVESVSYLRSRLRSSPTLFTNVPPKALVPQILEYLVRQYVKRKSTAGVTSLSGLLCNLMKSNTDNSNIDDFIGCVVASLHTLEQKESSQGLSVADNNTLTTSFFNKNGPLWRLALLDASASSDYAYKGVLLATAKSMINMPSSSIPLALLASLVDSQFHLEPPGDVVMDHLEKRIFVATSGIINFAMHQISPSRQDKTTNEESVFSRLAPLLMLRRIPRSYYRAVHKALPSSRETRDIMLDLSAFLSNALKAHAMNNDQSNLAKEEKKLLAELAGHCLPFSSTRNHCPCSSPDASEPSVSLFENICIEPFSYTLKSLHPNEVLQLKPEMIHGICEAKAALYAVSHYVPLALDEDGGEALLAVASFVFEVLNYQHQPALASGMAAALHELFTKETMMLQSGCTHFLAVCMGSLSQRKAKLNIGPAKQSPLIEELDCSGTSNETKADNAHSILVALSTIFHMLKSITTTGEIGWETLYHGFYPFPHHNTGGGHTTIQFSPSSRTAMLNSIVMLSQGIRAEDGGIDWLASNIMPTLVDWSSKGTTVDDDNIRHPLCIAAALQAIYTILARCGSFDWLSNNNGTYDDGSDNMITETDFVCRTLQCALKSFHTSSTERDGDGPTVNILRLAALKVILTVIALNQANEGVMGETVEQQGLKGYLSPKEIQQAMSALHGAANVDQNTEVRRLANQILPYLQIS